MDMNWSKLREIVKDRGGWRAAVHGVTKSQMWLSDWTTIVSEKESPSLIKTELSCAMNFIHKTTFILLMSLWSRIIITFYRQEAQNQND